VVVYKVDRLTRSLADFAKLVELFDQHGVSFVSVTQSFNTTTSMGRLTLNVLLSFAQFEREVIGDRVWDKIAASKRKGIWVGGPVPLGYRCIGKKIVVVPAEAETIRTIFRRYLELASMGALIEDLDRRGIRTKAAVRPDGHVRGGIRFGVGPLARISSRTGSTSARSCTGARCRIYDDRGNRMSPSHSNKLGVRYRYYVSHALLQNRKQEAGHVPRVPAPEIEQIEKRSMTPVFMRRHWWNIWTVWDW
jgi:site-specific DNA recombinase